MPNLAEMSNGKSGRDLNNLIARAEQKAVQRDVVKGDPEHFMLTVDDFTHGPEPLKKVPLYPIDEVLLLRGLAKCMSMWRLMGHFPALSLFSLYTEFVQYVCKSVSDS